MRRTARKKRRRHRRPRQSQSIGRWASISRRRDGRQGSIPFLVEIPIGPASSFMLPPCHYGSTTTAAPPVGGAVGDNRPPSVSAVRCPESPSPASGALAPSSASDHPGRRELGPRTRVGVSDANLSDKTEVPRRRDQNPRLISGVSVQRRDRLTRSTPPIRAVDSTPRVAVSKRFSSGFAGVPAGCMAIWSVSPDVRPQESGGGEGWKRCQDDCLDARKES